MKILTFILLSGLFTTALATERPQTECEKSGQAALLAISNAQAEIAAEIRAQHDPNQMVKLAQLQQLFSSLSSAKAFVQLIVNSVECQQ